MPSAAGQDRSLALGACLWSVGERWKQASRFGAGSGHPHDESSSAEVTLPEMGQVRVPSSGRKSPGRKDLGKQNREPGKSAVMEDAEWGLRRVASPHPVTHFPLQFPACGEEAASAGPWGSRSHGAAGSREAPGVTGTSRSAQPGAGKGL